MHYRVYQKDQRIRFEIELKHQQTKLVQDYLFNNQLDIFEHQLVIQYFKYSRRVLRLDYVYTDCSVVQNIFLNHIHQAFVQIFLSPTFHISIVPNIFFY